MDRTSFLRSLASKGGAKPTPDGPPAEVKRQRHAAPCGERKAYFQDLARSAEPAHLSLVQYSSKAERKSSASRVARVLFDLHSVREFKAAALQTRALEGHNPPERKRPNYNNSRRRLAVRPRSRVQYPGMIGDDCFLISLFVD